MLLHYIGDDINTFEDIVYNVQNDDDSITQLRALGSLDDPSVFIIDEYKPFD